MRQFAVSLLLYLFGTYCFAADVQVAVAANFAGPMKQIAEAFEKISGHRAVLSIGSTGKFYAQITNGAPFDVLLSADDETPARLETAGAAVAGSRFTYAVGRLVLWSPKPDEIDANGAVLVKGQFKRLAIASPKLAPYGAASVQVLTRMGALALIEDKLVLGDSIGQVYSMVFSGNAELGFVAKSQVYLNGKPARGSLWLVPADMHSPLKQDAVLLQRAKSNLAAQQLLQYLKSSEARAIMASFGYE